MKKYNIKITTRKNLTQEDFEEIFTALNNLGYKKGEIKEEK